MVLSCTASRKKEGSFEKAMDFYVGKEETIAKDNSNKYNLALSKADKRIEAYLNDKSDEEAYIKIKKSIDELKDLYKSVKRKKKYLITLYYLGVLYQTIGNDIRAKNYYRTLLLYEKHESSYVNLSQILIKEGDIKNAIKYLKPLYRKIDDDFSYNEVNIDANTTLAYAYYEIQQYKNF